MGGQSREFEILNMNINTTIKNKKLAKIFTLTGLSLLFTVGVIYVQAFVWQGPATAPPICNSVLNPGCNIPINDTSTNQVKSGRLGISTSSLLANETLAIGNGFAVDELIAWGDSALSISTDGTYVGNPTTNISGGLFIDGSTTVKQIKTVAGTSAGVCADIAGKLVQCATPPPPPGTPVVTLTLNGISGSQTSTYIAPSNSSLAINLSQPVTVAWSTMNLGGGVCTASGTSGWSGTKGATGGSESFSITKFGENTFNISCIKNGATKTATATLTLSGTRTYSIVASYDFTVPQNINSSVPYTVKVWGGGGGGGGNGTGASTNRCGGGGGGAGEYRLATITLNNGEVFSGGTGIQVGAGGSPGTNGPSGLNGTSGSNGTNSKFLSSVTAKGGSGGHNGQGTTSASAGGAGGTGGTGGAGTTGATGQNGGCDTVNGNGGPGAAPNNGNSGGGKGGGTLQPVAGGMGRVEVSW